MLPTLSSSSSHPLFQDHHIDYLMVTTKAHQTYSALLPWIQMGLLSNRSHILFLQNGIGHIDDVIQQGLLPFQLSPWLYLGITNHGAYRSFTTTTTSLTSSSLVHTSTLLSPSMTTSKERLIKKKEVTHSPTHNPVRTENSPVSPGQWWFSPYPFKAKEIHAPFLKKDPTSTSTWTSPLLHLCSKLRHSEVIPSEHMEGPWLQKFAMNCLVNPLTSMDHVQNGALLDSPCFKVYLDPLCEELTQVYQGTFPSLHTSHPLLLDPVHLSQRVQALCQLTSNNWSSMVMDLKAGQTTEIRYLTQTLLTWAQEARVKVPYHTFMYHQIKALERQHVKEGIRGTKRRD
ncbi:hypothetical protein HMI54_002054 [Coelomomyces lativittatus]|nr:hypothetical protein HMI54_002054 [Coelomomyces lativittatus]